MSAIRVIAIDIIIVIIKPLPSPHIHFSLYPADFLIFLHLFLLGETWNCVQENG